MRRWQEDVGAHGCRGYVESAHTLLEVTELKSGGKGGEGYEISSNPGWFKASRRQSDAIRFELTWGSARRPGKADGSAVGVAQTKVDNGSEVSIMTVEVPTMI